MTKRESIFVKWAAIVLATSLAAGGVVYGYGALNARTHRLETDMEKKVDHKRFDDVTQRLAAIEQDIKELLRRIR